MNTMLKTAGLAIIAGSVGLAGVGWAEEPSPFGRTGNQGEGSSTERGPRQPDSSMRQDAQITLGGARPTVEGEVLKIQGEDYTIRDMSGSEIRLRVTKDTNMDCATGGGHDASMATGRQAADEQKEIPPTAHMQQQSGSQEEKGRQIVQQQQSGSQEQMGNQSGTQSRSAMGQGSGGDVARGSGFQVGPKSGCAFQTGDKVKAEVSDLGTALFIKKISDQDMGSGSKGGLQVLPQR